MVVEKLKTEVRGYIRAIPGLSVARQRQMATDAGCRYVYEHGEAGAGGPGARGRWLAGLKAGDRAWVPTIQVLLRAPDERDKGYSPTADMAAITNHVLAIGAILVDARGKVTSETPAEWANHVLWQTKRAGQGERSIVKLRRQLQAARDAQPAGVTARWTAPAMADQLELQQAIWQSKAKLPRVRKLLHRELGGLSLKTLYAILGQRRDGKRGGRPPKTR